MSTFVHTHTNIHTSREVTICFFYQLYVQDGKQMNKETKLRIHNITAKAALKFGSEAWVLKKREEQRLEAAQMEFLRHLLGITKLDKEKNQCIRQKTGEQSIVEEIKQYQKKWLQHVQRMDTNRLPKQALQYKPKRTKEHRTTEEEMEGPTSSWGSRNRKHAWPFRNMMMMMMMIMMMNKTIITLGCTVNKT